jgi:hypothetical protein
MSSVKADEIIFKINEINEKFLLFSEKIDTLNNNIRLLKDNIEINTKTLADLTSATFANNKEELIIKNVKREKIIMSYEIILKFLSLSNVTGDVKMFKEYYITGIKKKLIPFRKIDGQKYQYWNDNKWNDDLTGEIILDIVTKNIQSTYLSINDFDNIRDSDTFIRYQTHITSITKIKNQKKFFNFIEKEFQVI